MEEEERGEMGKRRKHRRKGRAGGGKGGRGRRKKMTETSNILLIKTFQIAVYRKVKYYKVEKPTSQKCSSR